VSVIVPLADDSDHYNFTVELDGVTYGMEFTWNYRESAWYFDLSDSSGVLLLAHRKAVVGFPVTGRFLNEALPPGNLVFQDTSKQSQDPGLTDLGNRVQLFYFSAGEL
jgi:hypothetical protein